MTLKSNILWYEDKESLKMQQIKIELILKCIRGI